MPILSTLLLPFVKVMSDGRSLQMILSVDRTVDCGFSFPVFAFDPSQTFNEAANTHVR